jgi:ABC-type bacteriocin/lantibiotic exporter with double-glycine peptidase domain
LKEILPNLFGVGSPANLDPLEHLRALLSDYRRYLWTVVLYAAAVGLLGLATPVAVQALVNSAAFGTVLQPILVLSVLVLAGLLLSALVKVLKSWTVEVLQRRLFVDVVARLSYVLPRSDVWNVRAQGIEQPTHRFFELFVIQKSAASLLLGGVDAVLAGVVGLVVLAFYHPSLLAFDIVLMFAIAVVVLGLGRGGIASALRESSAKYRVASFLEEVEQAALTFRDRAGEGYARERIDALCGAYLDARGEHYRVVFRQLVGALATQASASAALLGLGGYLVVQRELTLGQLVAAELIVTLVVSALSDLGKHLETFYDLSASATKLDALLAVEGEPERDDAGSEELGAGPARLEIRELFVAGKGRQLFEAAELTLAPGSRTHLVGDAESGKSTLLDLLYRMRRAESGTLLLDGVDTRELSTGALRQRVAIVRGPEIVPGTIIDNVRLARPDVGLGKVRAVLDEVGLLDELSRLPEGLETELGPAGIRLSYSQAMRITLARAMVRAPGLLAVDADVSAISAVALRRVMVAISKPEAPWTLLVVGDAPAIRQFCTSTVHIEQQRFVQGDAR